MLDSRHRTTMQQACQLVKLACIQNQPEKIMQRKRQTTTDAIIPVPPVPTIITSSEVLTVQEAANLLKVPPSSIYEWTRYRGSHRGTPVPHRKVGKYLRFLRSELMAWLLGLPQSTNTRKRQYVRKNRTTDASSSVQFPATPTKTKRRRVVPQYI